MEDVVLSICQALAVPSRLAVHRAVGASPEGLRVHEIARQLGIGAPTVCFHLGVLLEAGLITRKNRGARSVYCLADVRYSLAIETAS